MGYITIFTERISIHALREEGDDSQSSTNTAAISFLSTPSARRATWAVRRSCCSHRDFYPRPPRGGRPRSRSSKTTEHYFYPRPPRGGRRLAGCFVCCLSAISIHALREEGDTEPVRRSDHRGRFLSTPSARRATFRSLRPSLLAGLFLSTPSARRATHRPPQGDQDDGISIHALREEGDRRRWSGRAPWSNFYPRPPRGGRRSLAFTHGIRTEFLSTPSARRATASAPSGWTVLHNFYPRPPRGGRPNTPPRSGRAWLFLSTPSARRATVQTRR